MEVGNGVVGVVLVLPPPHAEALHQVAPEHTREVAVRSVLEHLRNVGTASDRQRVYSLPVSVCLRRVNLEDKTKETKETCLRRVD